MTSVASTLTAAPALAADVMVNATPGVRACKKISPFNEPLLANTPKVLFSLIRLIILSVKFCGDVPPASVALVVNVVPLTTTLNVSIRLAVPVTFTLLT